MKKRALTLLVVLSMLLTLIPTSIIAEASNTNENDSDSINLDIESGNANDSTNIDAQNLLVEEEDSELADDYEEEYEERSETDSNESTPRTQSQRKMGATSNSYENVYFGSYFQEKITDEDELDVIYDYAYEKADSFADGWEKILGCKIAKKGYTYYIAQPIEWRVLEDNGATYTLISEKVLYKRTFNSARGWADSGIREWLNNDFLIQAFTQDEQNSIWEKTNVNKYLSAYENGRQLYKKEDNITDDKVWLLDEHQAQLASFGFGEGAEEDEGRMAIATQFADNNESVSDWYLRGEPYWFYFNSYVGKYVEVNGKIHTQGGVWDGSAGGNYQHGVRPVIVVSKSAVSSTKPEEKRLAVKKKNITEEMLYGEYNEYLDNKSYINMTSTLYEDMAAAMSNRSGWMDWLSEARYALRSKPDGAINNMIIKEEFGENKKNDQKKLAQELVYDLAEDEELSEIMLTDKIKAWNKANKEYYKIVLKHNPSAKEIEEIAKAYAPNDKKGQKEIQKNIKYFTANNEEFEKLTKGLSDIFKETDRILTVTDIVVSAYVTQQADAEIVNQLYQLVDKESDLGKGLKQIKADQEKELTDVILKNFIDKVIQSEIVEAATGTLSEEIIGGFAGESAAGAYAVATFFWWGMSYVLPGNKDTSDDTNRAWMSTRNASTLMSACRDYRRYNIRKAYSDNTQKPFEEMRADYMLLTNAYKASLVSGAKKVIKCAPKKEKEKLQEDLTKYKKKLGYEKYIESCLLNANAVFNTVQLKSNGEDVVMIDSVYVPKEEAYSNVDYFDIPEAIDGMRVVGIGDEAFCRWRNIETITIPDTVTSIGMASFKDCSDLNSLYMGNSIQSIGEKAFEGCTSLKTVDIPDTVSIIGEDAFDDDSGLTIIGVTGLTADTYTSDRGIAFESREKTPVSVKVEKDPNKKTYRVDESFDKTGMELQVVYMDGSSETIREGFAAWNEEFVPGTNTVTIMYGDCIINYDVQVTNDECEYTISYVDEYGENIENKEILQARGGEKIVAHAKKIDGYVAFENTQELTIGYDNRITFVYYPESKIDISEATIVIDDENYDYTGSRITPEAEVILDARKINEETDYNIFYGENIEESGFIVVEGIGDYEGIATKDFTINMPQEEDDPYFRVMKDGLRYELNTNDESDQAGVWGYDYDNPPKGTITICSSIKLSNGKTYRVTKIMTEIPTIKGVVIPDTVIEISDIGYDYYYNKIPGFTIYGKWGSEAQRYAIENGFIFKRTDEKKPDLEWLGTHNKNIPAVKGVKSKTSKKKIKVSWKKLSKKKLKKFDKVEIQVCPNKKFQKANTKRVEVKKSKKTATVKKLKKGTYYVRVRNVKGSGVNKQVSKWTKIKKVKVKK